jgi:hypothetical protein
MHPRIVMLALANILFDLLVLAAIGAMLLSNNVWLDWIGIARFALVAGVVAIGLVPMMYAAELNAVARSLANAPERVAGSLPAWAGTERSVRV